MPVLQNHFWLLAELRASEADDALVDTQQGRPAAWALPCCGNIWYSTEGWSKRCFSILHRDERGREESLL
eukprot:6100105-Lingulodinium_polyedra.AAC.1